MMTDNENLSRTADLARRNAAGIVSDRLDLAHRRKGKERPQRE